MGVSASDVARGRAYGIARTMRMQAAWEGKDNHTRHVENQIAYADAVAEAAFERMKAWVMAELPGLIQKELSKPQSQVKIQAKVDEKSLSEAKRKISDMFKSIFR